MRVGASNRSVRQSQYDELPLKHGLSGGSQEEGREGQSGEISE